MRTQTFTQVKVAGTGLKSDVPGHIHLITPDSSWTYATFMCLSSPPSHSAPGGSMASIINRRAQWQGATASFSVAAEAKLLERQREKKNVADVRAAVTECQTRRCHITFLGEQRRS